MDVRVSKIVATRSVIKIQFSEPLSDCICIDVYTPNTREPRKVFSKHVMRDASECVIIRWCNGFDCAYYRYDHHLQGPQFVSEFIDDNIKDGMPPVSSKKGLRYSDIEDGLYLGMKHTVIDLPIQDLLRTYPEGNTEPLTYQTKMYHINYETVAQLDEQIKILTANGVHTLINLLVCTPVDSRMSDIVQHPDYESSGRMSAINVTSEDSCFYLETVCNFLALRYTLRPEIRCIDGLILANEISVQGIWANAGHLPCEAYMEEYTRALRIAWQAGAKFSKEWRVYASLDNHWGSPLSQYTFAFDSEEMYAGRDCLTYLNDISIRDGDFNWNIAYHPYAFDLQQPDFYNDEWSTWQVDSPVVSFKNLEVLCYHVCNVFTLWQGHPRRIILSEQGFNSADDPALEYVQATAYGHAFKAVMQHPEIEAFIYHSHADNPHEEGLKLGLRRSHDFNTDDNLKPIYHVFKTIENMTYDNKYIWEHY